MSEYVGDVAVGATIRFPFNTTLNGAPITLAGTPSLAAYKDGNLTQITTGLSLSVDHDGVTGLHMVTVDTSADGSFYASGSDIAIVLAAGTVNAVSVAGYEVGCFGLQHRYMRGTDGAATPTNITAGTITTVTNLTNLPAAAALEATSQTIKAKTDLIPASPASTTNITAGIITTVTNLTNAPTAGDLTTTMKTSVQTAATASLAAFFTSAAQLVTDVWAATTRTLTAAADSSGITTLLSRLSALRAGYLDNLSAGATALEATAQSIKTKTDLIPASPAAIGSAMTLTSGERNSIADAYLDRTNGVESGMTPRQQMRLSAATDGGKTSGMESSTVVIRDAGDTKDRIVADVDEDGNRSSVTLDLD